jgi:hypothetical protein
MKMDCDLFETIKNGKFGKLFIQLRLFFIQNLMSFWRPFCKFDPFWPKNTRKVQNGLDQKVDVLEKKRYIRFFLRNQYRIHEKYQF